jgi:hypothetical protein
MSEIVRCYGGPLDGKEVPYVGPIMEVPRVLSPESMWVEMDQWAEATVPKISVAKYRIMDRAWAIKGMVIPCPVAGRFYVWEGIKT